MAQRRWTQSDITTLRRRLSTGGSLADISGEIDREPGDVARMIGRLRLRLIGTAEVPVA